MTDAQWEGLDHFQAHEFLVDGGSPEKMDYELLHRLDMARSDAGVAFSVTSAFREGDLKAHGFGYAVDISCTDSWGRDKVLRACLKHFSRVGVYNHHIHVDIGDLRQPEKFPAGVIWWGTSR